MSDLDWIYQIQSRQQQYQVNTGNLNIALIWHDQSDLDLHVICPCKTHIFFAQKKCYRCEGILDLDMNQSDVTPSDHPIENIYWIKPLEGTYHLFVTLYKNRRPDQQPVPYQCLVSYQNQTILFTGKATRDNNLIFHGDLFDLIDDQVLGQVLTLNI